MQINKWKDHKEIRGQKNTSQIALTDLRAVSAVTHARSELKELISSSSLARTMKNERRRVASFRLFSDKTSVYIQFRSFVVNFVISRIAGERVSAAGESQLR